MERRRGIGIAAGTVALLGIVGSGIVFQAHETSAALILGWPMVATLQMVEKAQDAGNFWQLAVLLPPWGFVLFCLFVHALHPNRTTLVFGLVTCGIGLACGLVLAFLSALASGFFMM